MKLDLPQPRTAMTTVFVVMQPQSGMVLAKSFYRFCGTLVGLVVMLALISLFSQQPELFITRPRSGSASARRARRVTATSARTASCSPATPAALIGIPAAQHPDGAFLWRSRA